MSRDNAAFGGTVHPLRDIAAAPPSLRDSIDKMDVFDLRGVRVERLPFAFGDTTAGNETELLAVVIGRKNDVDLPNLIENSNYFSNILRRAASGDLPGKTVTELERFINENSENIWENSWVRLAFDTLGTFARKTVAEDMLADFHPESALGFLAHELDFTHLRMLWRRWRKKAMMERVWFCGGVALFFTVLFAWGFRALPREEWQFLAVLPQKPLSSRMWDGRNLTFYGFFNALAQLVALLFFLLLASSVEIPVAMSLATILLLMSVAMPASRLLARLIEKKPNTATVSGGFFAGIVFAPAAVWLGSHLTGTARADSWAPLYAAMAIAYAFGEGTGRLGCLSFGCCYGRLLSDDPRSRDRFIRPLGLVFTGRTKKIAYASGWEGRPVWPVQAATSVIYAAAGLLGVCLFLSGHYRFALVVAITLTQLWRFISEFFRGDYRGERKISFYQIFSVFSALLIVPAGRLLSPSGASADLTAGFAALWSLPLILFLQGWTLFVFWHSGRSSVTGGTLRFHVRKENI